MFITMLQISHAELLVHLRIRSIGVKYILSFIKNLTTRYHVIARSRSDEPRANIGRQ
jgi:hypothetical protein